MITHNLLNICLMGTGRQGDQEYLAITSQRKRRCTQNNSVKETQTHQPLVETD